LQTIHLWVGLILSIPIILIGLSGSALLLQREILRWSIPAVSSVGESQSIASMVAAAQASVDPTLRANSVELPSSRGRPALVQFQFANRPPRNMEVYVDPVSLKVLGSAEIIRRGPIRDVLVTMHEYLMLPGHIGLPLVGYLAVALTFMASSGLILWWPKKGRWLSAFLVRRGARGLRLHLDLHHAAGIWGSVLLLILSISGIYLAFPQSVAETARAVFPSTLVADDPPFPRHPPPSGPDQAFEFATAALPDARVTGIQLPRTSDRPFMVQMETPGFGPSIPPITIAFDTKSGDISIDDPRSYRTANRVLNALYALHFSVGMGGVWTFLVFLAGLLPLLLAITGFNIWWLKRRAR
jgi:uncharacterized iron-regulated membrane protein